jgi:hypothetical protein
MNGWPRCPDCGGEMGMYVPPCPAAPRGALSHYCRAVGRETVTRPGDEGQSPELEAELVRFVGDSVATSRGRMLEAEERARCCALVAAGPHHGVLLQGNVPMMEVADGSDQLDEMWLDDAPEGVHVWEGVFRGYEINTPDAHEYDCEPIGAFRPLTAEEWARLARGERLWPQEEDPG